MLIMKSDFLRECMSEVGMIPIDEFNKNICMRCVNQGCARSVSNNLLFVKRTNSWEDELFLNVKRAPDSDSEYDKFRSSKFVSKTPSLGNISMNPIPEVPSTPPIIEIQEPKLNNIDESANPESTINPEPINPNNISPATGIRNTPFTQGVMLNEPSKVDPIIPVGGTFVMDDE